MTMDVTIDGTIEASGLSLSLASYRWSSGTEWVQREDAHVIRRRTYPSAVGLRARLGHDAHRFGELMFFPANQTIPMTRADRNEAIRTIELRFDQDQLAQAAEIPGTLQPDDLGRCLDLANGRVDQAMQWLGSEVNAPGFAARQMLESLSTMIMIELSRHFTGQDKMGRLRTRGGRRRPQILADHRPILASDSADDHA